MKYSRVRNHIDKYFELYGQGNVYDIHNYLKSKLRDVPDNDTLGGILKSGGYKTLGKRYFRNHNGFLLTVWGGEGPKNGIDRDYKVKKNEKLERCRRIWDCLLDFFEERGKGTVYQIEAYLKKRMTKCPSTHVISMHLRHRGYVHVGKRYVKKKQYWATVWGKKE